MRTLTFGLFIFLYSTGFGQSQNLFFKEGEWFKYRIHYGLLNAGFAELKLEESNLNPDEFHAIGTGKTTGMVSIFFKVQDRYESYFSKSSSKPSYALRRVDEGGYTIRRNIAFDTIANTAVTEDLKKKTLDTTAAANVYDLISGFYKMRTTSFKNQEIGDQTKLNLFFDKEIFPFQLKLIGREEIRTKFGKIKALKLRPLVQSGRVFKEEESLTLWVTDDKNKIPIRIKADLAVGSLRADLIEYKGLSHPFELIY